MGWQDTERGQTGMATVMKGGQRHVGWESVWADRTRGKSDEFGNGGLAGPVERWVLKGKKDNRLKLLEQMTIV